MEAKLNLLCSWSLRIWMVLWCLDGALRYELDNLGIGWLLYPRDALLGVVLLVAIFDGGLLRHLPFTIATATLLLIGTVVGLMSCSAVQVIFGFKILLATIAGMAFGCSRLEVPKLPLQASTLCFVCLFGVLLNAYFGELPWTGSKQEVMGIEVENSLKWTHRTGFSDDIVRPAGFARASYAAASQILILGVLIVIGSLNVWTIGLWLLVLLGIVLTTSKAMIFGWFVVTAAIAIPFIDREQRWARLALVIAVFTLVIVSPSLIFLGDFGQSRFKAGTISAALTDSFIDRLSWMWPESFELTSMGVGGVYLGRGIGVGTPARYFQPDEYNAGDNVFVFLFQMFGSLSIIVMGTCFFGLSRLNKTVAVAERANRLQKDDLLLFVLALAGVSCGVFSNLIEDSLLAMCLFAGVTRGICTRPPEPDFDDEDDDDDDEEHQELDVEFADDE